MSPGIPDDAHESRLTVGAKSVKDVLEHFPVAIGPKSDPQLIWRFDDGEVTVKSFEAAGG
jgi:cell cycle checkpoint control protein RAD9A